MTMTSDEARASGRAVALDTANPATLAERAERAARLSGFVRFSGIDPLRVGGAIRNFELGWLQYAAPVMEKVIAYDGTAATVSQKRYLAVAGADWEIATTDDSDEARRHADFLDDFFSTLSVREAEATDMDCGVEALLRHIASAIAMKYAAAEIEWIPSKTAKGDSTYHARATLCPARYFEATARRLRIVTEPAAMRGEELDPRSWIVAAHPGTPLALPTLILFMLKMTPLEDWAVTVETYAIPFLIAKTGAKKGDPEWKALEELVANAKNRFGAVVGSDVSVEVTNGLAAAANSPHRELVEYLDRAMVSLWRGGDLSTISQGGDGVGANPQQDEMEIIAKSDRRFVEGAISGLAEKFIRLTFGDDVRPKAYFKFSDGAEEEAARVRIAQIAKAYELGVAIPENFVRSALGIPAVAEGDAVVRRGDGAFGTAAEGLGTLFANAAPGAVFGRENGRILRDAEHRQYSEAEAWLRKLERAKDEEEFAKLLSEFRSRFGAIARRVMSRDDVVKALAGVESEA